MAITMLDAVEFSKIPALQFVVPMVAADPAGYEAGLIYNTTEKALKYHNGTAWTAVGGAGGAAGGDLSGTYPNPQIAAGVIVDADVNAAAAIATSKIAGLDTALTGKVPTTRTVWANAGLSGGGTLASDVSLDVVVGSGIKIVSDAVTADTAVLQVRSEKGVANGYAPLDSSNLIPTAHLPPLAINDVFTVASEAAMLALNAQVGDMAIRTDTGKTYVLSASPASTLANWKEIMATGQVVSVNGNTGVVTITLASLGGVATSRQVIAGAGLTGGGDLSSDRTLNVANADGTLTVTADDVKVASAPKWTTPQTITLTGAVTGSASGVDGSGAINIATTAAVTPVKFFAGDVGAGTSVAVVHNLGTRDVNVQVYRATTPWDTITCGVERTDLNTVTLKFASAVSASAFRVTVQGR